MKKGKFSKLVLAVILSAALVGSHMSPVYAVEASNTTEGTDSHKTESEGKASASESGSESETKGSGKKNKEASSAEAKDNTTDPSDKQSTSEASQKKDSQTETSEEASSEEKTEASGTETEVDKTETEQTESKTELEGTDTDTNAEAETEAETEAATETEIGTEAATESETETEAALSPETPFTNKDGESVTPSSLVGVDYTTIADSYDGETNVIKQYSLSEDYGANTIMESYVDENGNLVLIISQGSEAEVLGLEAEDGRNSSSSAPAVDGSFSGWEDIPVSYEYNWDNSQNCWNYGVWVDNVKYTTPVGSYDTNVRHGMQMYSDGENVYLNITFARDYEAYANGNDFQFFVDGQMAAYQIEWPDGQQLASTIAAPGTYQVDVLHRDSSWSYVLTDGASAYYRVNEGNVNNQLELKIPLSEFQKQNGNIDLDNYSMIQFFTPNLMYNRISAAGSPTGAVPFSAAVFLLVPASYVWLKRKKNGEALA
ncbi:MAG: hypothetical protein J6B10_00990 [Lachnospiraceae bacterium]|nr:hypothetical protein [Lachnospiraceae bacterium]